MTGYLLDTNVLAELRKQDRCNPGVRRRFNEAADESGLYLGVLVIGEMRRGGAELLVLCDPAEWST